MIQLLFIAINWFSGILVYRCRGTFRRNAWYGTLSPAAVSLCALCASCTRLAGWNGTWRGYVVEVPYESNWKKPQTQLHLYCLYIVAGPRLSDYMKGKSQSDLPVLTKNVDALNLQQVPPHELISVQGRYVPWRQDQHIWGMQYAPWGGVVVHGTLIWPKTLSANICVKQMWNRYDERMPLQLQN
jgi:hypothetical protein